MIEIEKTIINEKDQYLEIPLEDVVDDFEVTFTIVSYDTKNKLVTTVFVSKELLERHLKYTSTGLVCRVPLSQIL